MSRYETLTWPADPTVPGGRPERRSFRYQAFVPDPIAALQFSIPSSVTASVSAAERAVDALNRDPPQLLGRSKQAVNAAIAVLAESGVLRPLTLAKRNRAWEARELFDLVDDVERALAMPDEEGSSRSSPRRRD
jgi:hypothetical protein